MTSYDRAKIESQVIEWSTKTFGPTFKFRHGQKESVVETIYAWLTGTTDVISNMPTGSGKSIYAIIVAGVLIDYYNKRGYILCSDLGLLDQYARDIEKYLPEWSVLKGQQEYKCLINGMSFKIGQCKLMGYKSYGDIMKNCPECANQCPYIAERQKAICSPLTVVTYPFWLIQQNIVKYAVPEPPFDERDFTICDEAHKLISIVQDHFSPKFTVEDESKIKTVAGRIDELDTDMVCSKVRHLREDISLTSDNDTILAYLDEYSKLMNTIVEKLGDEKKAIASEMKKRGNLSKEKKSFLYACEFMEDHAGKFNDYVNTISSAGIEYMVVNESEDRKTTTFNCINETYLMDKYFHKQCKNKLYMSATIGDPQQFAMDVNAKNYIDIVLPSTFDFTNSPIYYVKEYNLSYKEKDMCLPRIAELIMATMDLYVNYRGIIQTGSYTFAKQLYDMVPYQYKERMLLYDDSTSKGDCMNVYKYGTNKVLVGPSLIEGISLDDDLCRFQIVMKVPYPSLKDKFVAAKMNFNPQWYSNTTAISILQGVGRGVRNEHDWCVTFIFDGCFTKLFNTSAKMFPVEFVNRLQIIPATALVH